MALQTKPKTMAGWKRASVARGQCSHLHIHTDTNTDTHTQRESKVYGQQQGQESLRQKLN